jgi:hypothetical protein
MVVGDEVEDVLLEVGARADDRMDLVAADHLGQRETELGGGHRPGEGDEHLAPGLEVRLVALGGIEERGGIEMPVMPGDEARDRPLAGRQGGIEVLRARRRAFRFHTQTEPNIRRGPGFATQKPIRRPPGGHGGALPSFVFTS